jgi:hypothetical protein
MAPPRLAPNPALFCAPGAGCAGAAGACAQDATAKKRAAKGTIRAFSFRMRLPPFAKTPHHVLLIPIKIAWLPVDVE